MKHRIILLAAFGALLLASCGTKSCRCYEYVNSRWTGPRTTATAIGTPCADLNSGSRLCNEMDDPILNPDDIAVGKARPVRK